MYISLRKMFDKFSDGFMFSDKKFDLNKLKLARGKAVLSGLG